MRQFWIKVGFFSVLLAVVACVDRKENYYRFAEAAPVEASYIDVCQELFEVDTLELLAWREDLIERHPEFGRIYMDYVLRLPLRDTSDWQRQFSVFLTNPLATEVKRSLSSVYPDLREVKSSLDADIGQYLSLFPQRDTPAIYFAYSEFAYFPFLFEDEDQDDAVGVCLEMFLGDSFPYSTLRQNANVFSDYNLPYLHPDFLNRKTMEVLVQDMLPAPQVGTLLDHMILNGKKLYILNEILRTEERIVHEFGEEQLEWCYGNEVGMWTYLVQEDLLFSKADLQSYIDPAPSTPGMPPEAPGRAVNWVGYRIVTSFVENNAIDDLSVLLEAAEPNEFLRQSGYSPR